MIEGVVAYCDFTDTALVRVCICGRLEHDHLRQSGNCANFVDSGRLREIDLSTCTYTKKPIPEELRWEVFERDDFRCKHCGSRWMLRADHIHPERYGGKATLANLQTLCERCNRKKGCKRA